MPTQLSPAHGVSLHEVRRALLETPGWESESTTHLSRTYLDTADWRVYRQGGLVTFIAADDECWLARLDLESGEHELRQRVPETPRFASELPPGRLRDRLDRELGVRALVPIASVYVEREVLRRVDSRQKTVARVALERYNVEQPLGIESLGWMARVEPVRGYDRAAADASTRLQGLGLSDSGANVALGALDRRGLEPGSTSSKWRDDLEPPKPSSGAFNTVRVDLDPAESSDAAFTALLRSLLRMAELNRPGAIENVAPEFLHNLRVAVRRTRSVLRASRHVLPSSPTERVAEELSWLQDVTGAARDLDVWVLGFDGIAATFPDESRGALQPLRSYLDKERAQKHERLARRLESDRAHQLVSSWRALAYPDDASTERDSAVAISTIAPRRVEAALARALKAGKRVDDRPTDEQLHELRKASKQLRYLLECFADVLPDGVAGALTPRLKDLQDVLGEHQDCVIQIRELGQFARVLESEVPSSTILLMGELIARLRDRQTELAHAHVEAWSRFRRRARDQRRVLR